MAVSRPFYEPFVVGVRSEILLTAWSFGLYTPPDRRVLDREILPYYAKASGFERALFVGVKAYNVKGHALFSGRPYATIDPNPAFARFGAKRHYVAKLEDLGAYADPGSLDVILVNGIIGHGLDDPDAIERSLAACFTALRPGGELVLGLNEETFPAFVADASPALKAFEPAIFPPLATSVYTLSTPLKERTHTFRFLRKPT